MQSDVLRVQAHPEQVSDGVQDAGNLHPQLPSGIYPLTQVLQHVLQPPPVLSIVPLYVTYLQLDGLGADGMVQIWFGSVAREQAPGKSQTAAYELLGNTKTGAPKNIKNNVNKALLLPMR